MPDRCESPLSRRDLLLAHPFLTAVQESREVPPPAARPDTLSAPAAGPRSPTPAHPDVPLPQAAYPRRLQAGSRLRFLCRALRRSFAASHCASELAQHEDEFESVLVFSLAGLALSLYLAAQIHMAGADEGLAGILMLLS